MSKIDKTGFAFLMARAVKAGRKAYDECVPTPMAVRYKVGDVEKREVIDDGLCGFAWVRIKPATSAFARWLSKNEHDGFRTHKGYPSGIEIWPADCSQSVARKKAWADAVADVLTEAGFNAYAGDRLD